MDGTVIPESGRNWSFVLKQRESRMGNLIIRECGIRHCQRSPWLFWIISRSVREGRDWPGPVDIVSHSMGTCIVRYLLEVTDGTERSQKVRQLIGLGPPNNGSALAELFHDPKRGEEIINKLTGVFVPRGFDPASDRIVQDVRPGSAVMQRLRTAGLRSDIIYRIIVTTNPEDSLGFFPWFDGRTWELGKTGGTRRRCTGMELYHTVNRFSPVFHLISSRHPVNGWSICLLRTRTAISTFPGTLL